jgi:hypothetical protein
MEVCILLDGNSGVNVWIDKGPRGADACYDGGMRWAFVGLLCASCATSAGGGGAALAEGGALTVTGARCSGAACTCRVVDDYGRGAPGDEGAVAPGHKRFELRTGRGNDPLAITVEGRGTLRKSGTDVDAACGYIDLPPGKFRVRLRANAQSADAGQVPALFIREYGERTKDWYDTFEFRCGGQSEVCTLGDMQAWIDRVQKVARGIWDPCGSVRVEGVKWNALRSVGVKLAEIEVELTLEVYKFSPRFPHGFAKCKGMDPTMKAEQEAEQR